MSATPHMQLSLPLTSSARDSPAKTSPRPIRMVEVWTVPGPGSSGRCATSSRSCVLPSSPSRTSRDSSGGAWTALSSHSRSEITRWKPPGSEPRTSGPPTAASGSSFLGYADGARPEGLAGPDLCQPQPRAGREPAVGVDVADPDCRGRQKLGRSQREPERPQRDVALRRDGASVARRQPRATARARRRRGSDGASCRARRSLARQGG